MSQKHGSKSFNLKSGNGFLYMTLNSQITREKIDKLDFIKIIKFCAAKQSIRKVTRQLAEQKEIFSNCVSDEGLISKYTKYSYNSTIKKKTNNPIKNRQN